jgi:hypothetical protein
MQNLLEHLEGQLTITLQMDNADMEAARTLMPTLEGKAGRLIWMARFRVRLTHAPPLQRHLLGFDRPLAGIG